MRKALRLALLISALALLLCIGVLADEPTESGIYGVTTSVSNVTITPEKSVSTVTIDSATVSDFHAGAEKLTVSYTAAVKDAYYLLIVTNKETTAPTASDIVYIDQATAGSTGVSFNAYPSALGKGEYFIYLSSSAGSGLGATGLDKIGSFKSYEPFIRGDVDGSGTVDVGDATRLLQHLAKISGKTVSGPQLLAADTDKSGTVDVGDATRLLQHLAKIPGKEIVQ